MKFLDKKFLFQLIIVCCYLLFFSQGKEWLVKDIPSLPDSTFCSKRTNNDNFFLCDPDQYLHFQTLDKVDKMIEEYMLKYKTPCDQKLGYKIFILFVEQIEPYQFSQCDAAQVSCITQEFAQQVHNKWGIGNAKCGDGVLLVATIKQRFFYLSAGSSALKYFPQSEINSVLDVMRPQFKKQNYDNGVIQGTKKMITILKTNKFLENLFLWTIIFVVVGLLIWGGIRNQRKEREYQTCKKKLQVIEQIKRADAQRVQQINNQSCPICLEDFGEKKTHILPCYHKFCTQCLSDSVERKVTCPICRQDIPEDEARFLNDQNELPQKREVRFRLNSLRNQYPHYISQNLFHNWMTTSYYNTYYDDVSFVNLRPYTQNSSSGGHSTSSRSFGGGSSSGGGGGGW